MTVVVVLLSLVVAVLCLLVAGLLRSNAAVLRRLDEVGFDLTDLVATNGAQATLPAPRSEPAPRDRTPRPAEQRQDHRAHDVTGATADGGAAGVRVADAEHDTLLLFLSTDCASCEDFWDVLGREELPTMPDSTRVLVVTKGPEQESPAAVAQKVVGVPVILSSEAWRDYEVPGSPYAVHVRNGQVLGEGTGARWQQVADLLARASGDLAWVDGAKRGRKARRDTVAERDADTALLDAGIRPGDDSLYRRADGTSAEAESGVA